MGNKNILERHFLINVAKKGIFKYKHQAWLKILIHQSTVINDFTSFQLVQLLLKAIISVVITFSSSGGARNTKTICASRNKKCLDTLVSCRTRRTLTER